MADYSLFKDWREERGAVYHEGAEVVTLLTIGKDGELGKTDGSIWWESNDSAWTVESNHGGFANRVLIHFDDDIAKYYDIGIVLTGSMGYSALATQIPHTGLRANIHVEIDSSLLHAGDDGKAWYILGTLLSLGSQVGVEYQSYLDGAPTRNTAVNLTNDAMQTFVWVSDISGLIAIYPDSGAYGFGIRFANALRNGSSFSIVAVRKPVDVPEPATLAVMGLGLAGVGLARRKKK